MSGAVNEYELKVELCEGRDAISYYVGLCMSMPKILLTIELKLPLCSLASPSFIILEGIIENRIHFLFNYTNVLYHETNICSMWALDFSKNVIEIFLKIRYSNNNPYDWRINGSTHGEYGDFKRLLKEALEENCRPPGRPFYRYPRWSFFVRDRKLLEI